MLGMGFRALLIITYYIRQITGNQISIKTQNEAVVVYVKGWLGTLNLKFLCLIQQHVMKTRDNGDERQQPYKPSGLLC